MKKHSLPVFLQFLIVAAIAMLAACKDNEPKEETPAAEKESSLPTISASSFLNGTLDTLWVSEADFRKIPKGRNVFFSYFFNRKDSSLTLHGWPTKAGSGGKTEFDTIPLLTLEKGRKSTAKFDTDLYFGNVLLDHKQVKRIIDSLDTKKSRYVLFAPQVAFTTKYGAEIRYSICLTNDEPGPQAVPKMQAVDPVGEDANPSPPKEYD